MLSVPTELVCIVIVSVTNVKLTIQLKDVVMTEIARVTSVECSTDKHRNRAIIVLLNQPDWVCFKVLLKICFGWLVSY